MSERAAGWRWCPRLGELRHPPSPDEVVFPLGMLAELGLTPRDVARAMTIWRDVHGLGDPPAEAKRKRRKAAWYRAVARQRERERLALVRQQRGMQ